MTVYMRVVENASAHCEMVRSELFISLYYVFLPVSEIHNTCISASMYMILHTANKTIIGYYYFTLLYCETYNFFSIRFTIDSESMDC